MNQHILLPREIAPDQVHEVLGRHVLADGFRLVYDTRASRGSWVIDARSGEKYLDLYTFFASAPLGSNPRGLADDPDFKAWAERVRAHVLPMINESALTMSLVPTGDTDIKFAVELGLSIMLDKPIIAVVQPGTKVPEHLVRVADEIVEADLDNPQGMEKVQVAIEQAYQRIEEEESA